MAERQIAALLGLARNLAASEEVLLRLARHDRAAKEMSARRKTLPDSVVIAILARRDPDAILYLHRRRVSPAMIARIAADPDPAIRDARASFVRHMVEVGVSLGIEDLEDCYGQSRSELARNLDPRIRAAVARAWWTRPADVHAALLTDRDPTVRSAASLGHQPPVPLVLQPACLADAATRAHVAHYAFLTPEFALGLATDPDEHVRAEAARNPNLTPDAVALLVADPHPFVRGNIVLHPLIDEDTRDRLYEQLAAEMAAGNIEAKVALQWNFLQPDWIREIPLPARLAYLDSPHAVFRIALASSRDLPPDAWRRLDQDPNRMVRHRAALRPETPPAVLEQFVRTFGDDSKHQPPLVDHPNFPRHRLPTFADEAEPNVRRIALKDPNLPSHLLVRLAADPDVYVRRAVANHTGLNEVVINTLLADNDNDVVSIAAANPALPADRMQRILNQAGL
ncbi:MAG TPA: hypothetical protein VHA75_15780 [Rugosimonospora sp.]|nr:hypothetical protein [Rugosimonospora sp.]